MLTTVEGIYENGAIRLLEPLAGVSRARVAVTVLPSDTVQAATAETSGIRETTFRPSSALGERLLQIRRQALASGLCLLSQDEVLAEIRHRRGEDE